MRSMTLGDSHTAASLRAWVQSEFEQSYQRLKPIEEAYSATRARRWQSIPTRHRYHYVLMVTLLNLTFSALTALAELPDKHNVEYVDLYFLSLDKNLVLDSVANFIFIIALLPVCRVFLAERYIDRFVSRERKINCREWLHVNEGYSSSEYLLDIERVKISVRWHYRKQVTQTNLTELLSLYVLKFYNSSWMKMAILSILPRLVKQLANPGDGEAWNYPIEVVALFTMLMFHQPVREYALPSLVNGAGCLAFGIFSLLKVLKDRSLQCLEVCCLKRQSPWQAPVDQEPLLAADHLDDALRGIELEDGLEDGSSSTNNEPGEEGFDAFGQPMSGSARDQDRGATSTRSSLMMSWGAF